MSIKEGDRVRRKAWNNHLDDVPAGTEGTVFQAVADIRWPYYIEWDLAEDAYWKFQGWDDEDVEKVVSYNTTDTMLLHNLTASEAENSLKGLFVLLTQPARFVTNEEGTTADTQLATDTPVFNDAFGEYSSIYEGYRTLPNYGKWAPQDSPHPDFWDVAPPGYGPPEDDEQEPFDMVHHPPHYTRGGIEVLDFILAYFADDYLGGQVVKYLARAGHKWDTLEDVKKAAFYLNKKLEVMQQGQGLS